ncbi:MAG: hypothetical protein FGM32_03630 [Candidatus Kapabacteria bacterium]|nr:hypothetical protein [Candidatus Kapabacteria bacterium]
MTRIVILSFVQSALAVGGIGMLHSVLDGKPQSVIDTLQTLVCFRGIAGSGLLLLGFVVMSYMLTLTKASVFIPLNTATTFILTVAIGLISQSERLSAPLIVGMMLVLSGIALIATQRG